MSGILTKLEAYEIVIPLPEPIQIGAMFIPHREYAIVRAYDDAGHVGTAYGLTRNAPMSAIVRRLIAPHWENQALDEHATFYERSHRANIFLGTNGLFWRALSLADCALYDLLAQRANLPLCEFLGGELKTIPATLAGCYPLASETPDSLRQQMVDMQAYQPAGIKITSCSDYARDTERLRICRDAIPDGAPFIIDLYCGAKDADSLIPYAREWDTLNMGWVEDPFEFDDYENMAALVNAIQSPVAMGDEQSGLRHYRRMIEQGKLNMLRLDATVCGGVRSFIQIAQMAAERGIPVSSHVFHFLHAHLATVVPNLQAIEYMLPESGVESIQRAWVSDMAWQDGGLVIPNRPGVGYEWDEDALVHFRVKED